MESICPCLVCIVNLPVVVSMLGCIPGTGPLILQHGGEGGREGRERREGGKEERGGREGRKREEGGRENGKKGESMGRRKRIYIYLLRLTLLYKLSLSNYVLTLCRPSCVSSVVCISVLRRQPPLLMGSVYQTCGSSSDSTHTAL